MQRAQIKGVRRRVVICALLLGLVGISSAAQARELRTDEYILFPPQPALRTPDQITLTIESFVYERERRPGVHSAFALYLGVDSDDLAADQQALFRQRTQLFRIDAERGKTPRVRFADGTQVRLARSDAKGRSSTPVQLEHGGASSSADWLDFTVMLPTADSRQFAGRAQLLDEQGWSVISDIDDTIKHSAVRDKDELLLNTFVRPFVAVPQLAQRYQELARLGVRFHYVSSSPLQLYPPLAQFIADAGFPEGSMHLRTISLRQEIFASGEGSRAHKIGQISMLLQRFAQRHFILIGDSGEADPEIYAQLLSDYPEQIRRIYIRDVSGEARGAQRYSDLLSPQLSDRLHVFSDAAQLPIMLSSTD